MGITIARGIEAVAHLSQDKPYNLDSVETALRMLAKGFAPLQLSTQEKDKSHFLRAHESLGYLAQALALPPEAPFIVQPARVTNRDFLTTLAYIWKDYNLLAGSTYDRDRISGERVVLEDIGIRTLWRIGAIQTCLFKDQMHYSVFGVDLARMHETLEESLANQGKARRR
ncbi:hypothetical protein FJZ22_00265 [Candidatus Pacearchaeota archaeon]|nr:hypothetical protein [Candidatus Pacearchaeota archaeon]